MIIRSIYLVIVLALINSISYTCYVETIYGSTEINEPVLIEILQCPSMQRLHNINQYGIIALITDMPPYSRYTHSVGVFFLVRKAGGSLTEQIAALLHDVSHTVFSHVGDFLFNHFKHTSSYQDDVHVWHLEQTEIPAILQRYGFCIRDINHKQDLFKRLDQEIPNLCADRLEYILYGGLIDNLLTHEDIDHIMHNIYYANDTWICATERAARLIGYTSLYLTEHRFGTAYNCGMYYIAAQALRRALDTGIINMHDIHYGTDISVWHALQASNDQKVHSLLQQLQAGAAAYERDANPNGCDFAFMPKFRGVDPYVQIDVNRIARLTSISQAYQEEYNRINMLMKKGIYLRFIVPQN